MSQPKGGAGTARGHAALEAEGVGRSREGAQGQGARCDPEQLRPRPPQAAAATSHSEMKSCP